jgi:hypothetical protein
MSLIIERNRANYPGQPETISHNVVLEGCLHVSVPLPDCSLRTVCIWDRLRTYNRHKPNGMTRFRRISSHDLHVAPAIPSSRNRG